MVMVLMHVAPRMHISSHRCYAESLLYGPGTWYLLPGSGPWYLVPASMRLLRYRFIESMIAGTILVFTGRATLYWAVLCNSRHTLRNWRALEFSSSYFSAWKLQISPTCSPPVTFCHSRGHIWCQTVQCEVCLVTGSQLLCVWFNTFLDNLLKCA